MMIEVAKKKLKLVTYISLFCCMVIISHMESKAQEQELEPQEVYQNYLNEVSDILQSDYQFFITSDFSYSDDVDTEDFLSVAGHLLEEFSKYYGEGSREKWKNMSEIERYHYSKLVVKPYSIFMENPTISEEEFVKEACDGLFSNEVLQESGAKVYQYVWNYRNKNDEFINVIEPEIIRKNKEIEETAEEVQKQEEKELEELQKELGIETEKENSTLSTILLLGGGILLGGLITLIVAKKKSNDKDGVR